jgi:tRNA(fMet)-specific endonuclease VapC
VGDDHLLRGTIAGLARVCKAGKPHELPARYAKLRELNEDFSTRPVLPFDDAAADVYQELLRKRTGVGAMDLKIAAIALATDELLISANLRHFKTIPGWTAEDWTAP